MDEKNKTVKVDPVLTEEIPAMKKKSSKPRNPLVGNQAQAASLDSITKLDIDTKKVLIDNIIDAGLSGRLDTTEIDRFTSISNARDQVYQLLDSMCQDSSVASIIRTYTEDVCVPADNGHVMWAEANNPAISKFVNYLLNTMNVDKNIYGWTYCLLKYGDVYLRLYRESDYDDRLFKKENITRLTEATEANEAIKLNIHSANDPYSYYIEMVADPSTVFELTKYGTTYGYIEVPNVINTQYDYSQAFMGGQSTNIFNYKLKSNDVNVFQADDFVHACLADNFTRTPETVQLFTSDTDYNDNLNALVYNVRRGKSLLYDSYKIWREKALLENAALLNRITRSSILRKVSVEVGDMPKEQVQQTLRRVKELIEQKTAVNTDGSMYEYNNPGPSENFIYNATHNGQGAINIDSIGGDVEVKNLADLDWWNNKFYSSYGIPKQYFGWCLKGDTKILLLNGYEGTIKELFENRDKFIGEDIAACNPDGSVCATKISNIMLTKPKATFIRIYLNNEKYVDVTPEHRMMLRDGSFRSADTIQENDLLMPYQDRIIDGHRYIIDNKNSDYVVRVIKIEYLDVEEPAYDISVEADCHTFALPCGIFVHNCDDGAGFNGGTSLSIMSSVYAKGVKRVQNSIIQAVTDLINLICLSKGLKSYLNNFTIKMNAPITQEEIDYRNAIANKINAVSNAQSLFADIEDKGRKLTILKALISSLNYGNDVVDQIDLEIEAYNKQKKLDAEEAAAEAAAAAAEEEDMAQLESPAEELTTEGNEGDEDLELTPIYNEALEQESIPKATILTEEQDFSETENIDLPTPEEIAKNIDFTENN